MAADSVTLPSSFVRLVQQTQVRLVLHELRHHSSFFKTLVFNSPQLCFFQLLCNSFNKKMGNVVSFQVSCDQTLGHIYSCFCGDRNLIKSLPKNVKALEGAQRQLEAKKSEVLSRIETEELKGLQRTHPVEVWLSEVDNILARTSALLDSKDFEYERLCFCGVCSKNAVSSHRYCVKVVEMCEEVETVRSRGVFSTVADRARGVQINSDPLTTDRNKLLDETWNCLMNNEVGVVGLHGMAGVGKTTMLIELNNRFSKTNEFEVVIWIVVSKNLRIRNIQEAIRDRLGLCDDEKWKQKTEFEKANDIWNVLQTKRFVLLLDDLWTELPLKKIGLPTPTRDNGCKIVFTTRCQNICRNLRGNAMVKVECLSSDEAWELFQNIVGETTLNSHPDIPKLARAVAKKCGNLPLALHVIGNAMASKITAPQWRWAVNVLNSSGHKFRKMKDEILPILKLSYDNLEDEKVKSCFLYCALYAEDGEILKEELIDQWICEAFIGGEDEDRNRAVDEGHDIIATLVDAHLLVNVEIRECVKMHDVIREMALWIASDFGNQKEAFFVKAREGICHVPKIQNWETVKRLSLMENEIEHVFGEPICPELSTLLLGSNCLLNIDGEFFRSMPKLAVLDVSQNIRLTRLPEEISSLLSLEYLNLSRTWIRQLPVGLKELRKLKYLNLEWTVKLQSISISSFPSLQVLRLIGSGAICDFRLLEELKLLEQLRYLTIDFSDAFIWDRFLCIQRLAGCVRELGFRNLSASVVPFNPVALGNLRLLGFTGCEISEIEVNRFVPNPSFDNLKTVHILDCRGLRDLTWLVLAQNVTNLTVQASPQMKELINGEKADRMTSGRANIKPFGKLKRLCLINLGELKSICLNPLPFPSLKDIRVLMCPALRRLPLDSESAKEHFVTIIGEKEWAERIEWEDEATKERFFPKEFL